MLEKFIHCKYVYILIIAFSCLSLGLVACGDGTPTTELPSATSGSPRPTITSTPATPTPTPVALAAIVNGEGITRETYLAELDRYQAAVNEQLSKQDEERVLNDLINQHLLAQAAVEAGFIVDEKVLKERIDQLVDGLGSIQALYDWMETNGYTEEIFREDLSRSIAAAWMRDKIIAEVPENVEQVHVRQILLYNSAEAEEVIAQLDSGANFDTLAAEYNPVTKGDIGWFPRGYLMDLEIEEAAFNLEPEEYSQVIKTSKGYHIIKVIERDPERSLEPDPRLVLQMRALQDWLEERRKVSDIQVTTP